MDQFFDMTGGGDDSDVNDHDNDDDEKDGDTSAGASTHAFFADTPSSNPSPVIHPQTDKQSADMAGEGAGAPQSTTTACDTDTPQHNARNDLSRAVAVAVTTSSSRPLVPAPAPAPGTITSITSTAGREPSAREKPLSLVLPAFTLYTPCPPRTTDNNAPKDQDLADQACALVREPVAARPSAVESAPESSSAAPESPTVDAQSLLGLVTAWSRVWVSLVASPTPGSTGTPTPDPQLPRSHPSSSWFAYASSKSSTKSRGSDRVPWTHSWTLSSGESGKNPLASQGGLRASNKFSMKLFPSNKIESLNQPTAAVPIPIPAHPVAGTGAGTGTGTGTGGAVVGEGKMSFTTWMDLVGSPPSTSRVDTISRRTDNATTYTMGARLA